MAADALDVTDINSARSLFQAIDNEGDVSIMVNTEDGTFQPQVLVVGVDQHASSFVPAYAAFMGQGVPIEAGESLTWEAPAPED